MSDRLEQLRADARYRRERLDLYRAKVYGPRPTSPSRLAELVGAGPSSSRSASLLKSWARDRSGPATARPTAAPSGTHRPIADCVDDFVARREASLARERLDLERWVDQQVDDRLGPILARREAISAAGSADSSGAG